MNEMSSSFSFVGHTRFSLFNPRSTQWKVTSGNRFKRSSEYFDYLYSEERMSFRLKMLIEYSLPVLERAAEKYKIRHIVSYSSNMPEEYKNRLIEAHQRFPFLVLDECPVGDGATPWQELLSDAFTDGEMIGAFRLDDDDVLGAGFFEGMSKYLKPEFQGMVISLARGFTAVWDGQTFISPREVRHPMLGIGLTYVYRRTLDGRFEGPSLKGGHNVADRYNPVVLDSRSPSFFWTRSADQDTSTSGSFSQRLARALEIVKDLPPAESNEFRKAFPGLDIVSFPQSVELDSGSGALTGWKVWELDSPAQRFTLKVDYSAPSGIDRKNYLFSFDIRDAAGHIVDEKIECEGLSYSENPNVGHFRYSSFRAGTRSYHVTLALPDGMFCHGVTLREWLKPNRPASLRGLTMDVEK